MPESRLGLSGGRPGRVVHTIPIPLGWSIEQSWEAICRGVPLEHPAGEPSWANIEVLPMEECQ